MRSYDIYFSKFLCSIKCAIIFLLFHPTLVFNLHYISVIKPDQISMAVNGQMLADQIVRQPLSAV